MTDEPTTEASNPPSPATSCGSYPATVCSASDLRTAARITRWIMQTAEEQIASLPWWRRWLESYPKEYLRLMVCNLEAMADLEQNAEHDTRH